MVEFPNSLSNPFIHFDFCTCLVFYDVFSFIPFQARFLILLCVLTASSTLLGQQRRLTFEEALFRPHRFLSFLKEDAIRIKTLVEKMKKLPTLNLIANSKMLKAKPAISLACGVSLFYLVSHPYSKYATTSEYFLITSACYISCS